jgi:hypothetical protein
MYLRNNKRDFYRSSLKYDISSEEDTKPNLSKSYAVFWYVSKKNVLWTASHSKVFSSYYKNKEYKDVHTKMYIICDVNYIGFEYRFQN